MNLQLSKCATIWPVARLLEIKPPSICFPTTTHRANATTTLTADFPTIHYTQRTDTSTQRTHIKHRRPGPPSPGFLASIHPYPQCAPTAVTVLTRRRSRGAAGRTAQKSTRARAQKKRVMGGMWSVSCRASAHRRTSPVPLSMRRSAAHPARERRWSASQTTPRWPSAWRAGDPRRVPPTSPFTFSPVVLAPSPSRLEAMIVQALGLQRFHPLLPFPLSCHSPRPPQVPLVDVQRPSPTSPFSHTAPRARRRSPRPGTARPREREHERERAHETGNGLKRATGSEYLVSNAQRAPEQKQTIAEHGTRGTRSTPRGRGFGHDPGSLPQVARRAGPSSIDYLVSRSVCQDSGYPSASPNVGSCPPCSVAVDIPA
ncbi:hypothetical protein F4802DRAFT_426873 [Xylaria palmicola]|nr:hypothetical protein F4802DRAFT_426873 [Xylaria palmicola]